MTPDPMLLVHRLTPAWGLPCVSPFVTKLVWALQWARVPHRLVAQDPMTLAQDSPSGKLPWVLCPDGRRLADSSELLQVFVPDARATGASPLQQTPRHAIGLLVQRLVDEHLYWHAVVEPRWADDAAWHRYRTVLFGTEDLPAPAQAMAEAFRERTLAQWRACGLGRLPAARRAARAAEDVAALAELVQHQERAGCPFLAGDAPGHADFALASMTAHALQAGFASAAAEALHAHPSVVSHRDRLVALLPAA